MHATCTVCIHMCIHTYVHIHIYVSICVCTHTYNVHICIYLSMCMHACMYTHTYKSRYVILCMHVHIFICICIPSSKSLPTVPGPSSLNLPWNEDIVVVNSFTCSQVICIHMHIHAYNHFNISNLVS